MPRRAKRSRAPEGRASQTKENKGTTAQRKAAQRRARIGRAAQSKEGLLKTGQCQPRLSSAGQESGMERMKVPEFF